MGVIGKVIVFLLKLFSKNPAQGAATSVFAATAPELAGRSGTHLANCAVVSASPEGQDPELAERLWAVSEQFVGGA
jgi:alanine-alpha-ketoisovalerate/valine-pyruvate aminotransferase